jgi:hypothetical protein
MQVVSFEQGGSSARDEQDIANVVMHAEQCYPVEHTPELALSPFSLE